MQVKSSISERVSRWRSFYRRENAQPLLGYFVQSEFPLHRYAASQSLPEACDLSVSDFPIGGYLDDADRLFAAHEACGGDAIWSGFSGNCRLRAWRFWPR